ncbi:BrnT family toxin [Mesorhizobium australicum]|uniref:Uncharacterized protein n=1 Tax=Mesorhizobium australicum TaxID=536018 RepID=A0A1X7NAX0_9HYPH|nr:BrnT family toxin [Mesorhizobium australicum]SMH34226.1 hypothetical protein SAMN02982922_1475 [Mesorhizobium australicum]
MEILWDELKRIANLDKHGLDFAALTEMFFETSTVIPAKHERWMAVGYLEGRKISVVFRPLGREALSVMSMRPAGAKERNLI